MDLCPLSFWFNAKHTGRVECWNLILPCNPTAFEVGYHLIGPARSRTVQCVDLGHSSPQSREIFRCRTPCTLSQWTTVESRTISPGVSGGTISRDQQHNRSPYNLHVVKVSTAPPPDRPIWFYAVFSHSRLLPTYTFCDSLCFCEQIDFPVN